MGRISFEEASEAANKLIPCTGATIICVRGRAMEIVYDDNELKEYMKEAVRISPEHPILVDKFLEDAIEIDVDAYLMERGIHRRDHGAY